MTKLSRRKALAMLASGFGVGGAIDPPRAAAAAACDQAITHVHKNVPKIQVGGTNVSGTILECFSCCTDAQAAMLASIPAAAGRGRGNAPPVTTTVKSHLQPIANELADLPREALEEYCLM